MSTPSYPMDCSPPGSSIHGILQARVLEWGYHCFLQEVGLLCYKREKHYELEGRRVMDGRVVVSTLGNFKLSNVVMIVS